VHGQKRGPVLTGVTGVYLSAEMMSNQLHAVADAQHRNAGPKRVGVDLRRARVVDARGSSAQDQARRLAFLQLCPGGGTSDELAVNVRLPHPACDELAELRAVVEDEDRLLAHTYLLRFPRRSRGVTPGRGGRVQLLPTPPLSPCGADSSAPARGVPIVPASAPAANALHTSAPMRIPPSVITATRMPPRRMCSSRAAATSAVAVTCGTPTPSTPRVVHA